MKIKKINSLLAILTGIFLLTACGSDDETTVSPFVGNYSISNSKVAANFEIGTSIGNIPIPAETDITSAVQTALLSAVTCSSADDTYIELRDDKSMYMSCKGENVLNAGTWEEISSTTLKLNMNSAAIPSSPSGFVLTVTNVVISGNKLQGTTTVPMPKEMFMGFLPAGVTIADSPPVYLVTFSIELTKK